MPRRILFVLGTRPEVIKLAPVIAALRRDPQHFETIILSTGQHRELLDAAFRSFDLKPDLDLGVMQRDQDLPALTAALVAGCHDEIVARRPDAVIVQGDTSTAFCAALAAYYARVPVGHVEAGLRTGDKYRPFPEEINRRLISSIADWHFAPTRLAVDNLRAEGVAAERIHLTGNTIVDALMALRERCARDGPAAVAPELRALVAGQRSRPVLITCHRRENMGAGLLQICSALRRLAAAYPDVAFVMPVHPNPNVRDIVIARLSGTDNLRLCDPLDYESLVWLMSNCQLILTDSGGIQEEAPTFGVPVLVLRDKSERPEAVAAGFAQLVGNDEERILAAARAILDAKSSNLAARPNPFGDGKAAARIAAVLAVAP